MELTTTELDRLAHLIATEGIAAVEQELPELVAAASRVGAPSVLLAVLSDPAQPEVARARAFGSIATRVTSRSVTRSADEASLDGRSRASSTRRLEAHRARRAGRVPATLAGALQTARVR